LPQEVGEEDQALGPEKASQGREEEVGEEGEAQGSEEQGDQGAQARHKGGQEEGRGAEAGQDLLPLPQKLRGKPLPQGGSKPPPDPIAHPVP